jgi:DNA-binding LacI/PurR family transcriptional regulator
VSGALSENDLRMVVAHLPSENQLPDSIVKKEVDGVIVRGGELSEKLLNKLKNIPAVWLFQRKRRLLWGDQVLPDNQAVGEMAVDYLLAQGCKSSAVVSVQPDHSAFHVRTTAFAALARDAGMEVHLMEEATEIAAMADRLVGAGKNFDGLFLPEGDDRLIRLYLALREKGVRLGRDIKTISCSNDYRRLAVLGEDLPNIDIRPEFLSQTAVEVLLWRMKNPREPIRVLMIAPRMEAGG